MVNRLVAPFAVLLVFCGAASADILSDPDMSMDAGSFSTPLSQFVSFTPSQVTGGGILDLYNDTGHLLTSFGLSTYIKTGLTSAELSEFKCSTGPNPFFLNCGITYDPTTGELTISFFGVKPADGDELYSAEIGEQEGIPPLKRGCTDANADSRWCQGQGHFAISFNDSFSFTGDTGGWSPTASPDLFSTAPAFVLSAPEPSALLLAATVLLALAGLTWRRRGANGLWHARAGAAAVRQGRAASITSSLT
jgi:hypothetical protein